MSLEKTISKNLRSIRHLKGLSQRDLANAIDVDEKFISQLENKPRHVSTRTLERLAIGLGVPVTELLQSVNQPKGSDRLPVKYGPGLDEAIKILKMMRSRVKDNSR